MIKDFDKEELMKYLITAALLVSAEAFAGGAIGGFPGLASSENDRKVEFSGGTIGGSGVGLQGGTIGGVSPSIEILGGSGGGVSGLCLDGGFSGGGPGALWVLITGGSSGTGTPPAACDASVE